VTQWFFFVAYCARRFPWTDLHATTVIAYLDQTLNCVDQQPLITEARGVRCTANANRGDGGFDPIVLTELLADQAGHGTQATAQQGKETTIIGPCCP